MTDQSLITPDLRAPAQVISNLSIFIIARNEGDRIGRTLDAVKGLASEVIVVDSGSTDNTVAVAIRHGAHVVFNDWRGYGEQKRFAEEQCTKDWLLNLDADEVVTPRLYAEIRTLFDKGEPAPQGFSFPIVETFPHEKKPHMFGYALSPVRLYHKTVGRYNPSTVHDRVDLVKGTKVTALKGKVAHYSVRSMGEQIEKLIPYADAQAKDMLARRKIISPFRLLIEFPSAFLKAYIGRRHCLRGLYGIASAINFAYFRHLRLVKYFETTRWRKL